MKKLLALPGSALMVLSVALLLLVLHYPPPFAEFLLCPNGTTLDRENIERNFSRKNRTAKCRDQTGETTDVTGRLLLTLAVPFAAGFLLIIGSVRNSPRQQTVENQDVIIVNFKSGKRFDG